MNIAIIGTGNLGLSIAKGLIEEQSFSALHLTKRNTKAIEHLTVNPSVYVTNSNVDAVKNTQIIILTVQPRHIKGVLREIKPELTSEHIIISTAAGTKIADIENEIGANRRILRAMPNTAISVGMSMTCVCANEQGKQDIETALGIFNELGLAIQIPEEQMQAATVICASGIAFWMRLIRATTQGAIQLGFESDVALEMSVQTCLGAASLLQATGNHPEEEIDRVTTPGGCTIEGLNEMEHRGLSSSLIKGLVASYDKINQITTN